MTTNRCGKMKNAEIAALKSQIDYYTKLIAQHDKCLQSSSSSPVENSESLIVNKAHPSDHTNRKPPIQTSSKITENNGSEAKFPSNNLNLQQSSLIVSKANFSNRTVHLSKNPVSNASLLTSKKLPAKPIVKESPLSLNSSYKYSNEDKSTAVLHKKNNSSIGNSVSLSNVPNFQSLQSSVKDVVSTSSLNVKLDNSLRQAKNELQMKLLKKAPVGKYSKTHSEMLCEEIMTITEQLKQATKSLSSKKARNLKTSSTSDNIKSSAISIGSSNLIKGCATKSVFSSVPTPKSSLLLPLPKLSLHGCETGMVTKNKNDLKLMCTMKPTTKSLDLITNKQVLFQNVSAKQNVKNQNTSHCELFIDKTVENLPATSIKLVKRLQNPQMTSTPMKNVKTPVSVKKKVTVTKLISSKFKVVNKKSPNLRSLSFANRTLLKNTNIGQVSQPKGFRWPQKEKEQKPLQAKLLHSKYKVVNKNYQTGNIKSNPLKYSIPTSLKMSKHTVLKKRKSSQEFVNMSKELKICGLSTPVPFKTNPVSSIGPFSNKFHMKRYGVNNTVYKNLKAQLPITRLKVQSLSCLPKSKYKVINGTASKLGIKASENLKSRSNKFNFSTDMDVDLLMELAAEKNSHTNATPKSQDRPVLFKRLYKSKNTIINRNVSSAQVKTAKMIKSKYLSSNKKHFWHKQAKSRSFTNFKNSPGGLKSFHSTSYYNQRNRRDQFKHKRANYTNSTYFSRNAKGMHLQNKFGTFKSFKRISANHRVFMKTNIKKPTTPMSKHLASRALQHSINRVLTASVKKKMSKVNTYCMFYNRFGRCNKGTKCTYIHDPSKIAICTRFLRGTCKDVNCLFSHEKCPGKMAICSFFLSGSCTKPDCPYRHEMLSPGAELCKAFVQGYCPKGKQCNKAHILVCPDYVQGFCSKGDACAFPHPPPKEKKMIEKTTEKCENQDSDEFLMERVSRYFQPSGEETSYNQKQASNNSVVPKRKNLPEQPSFISLSLSNCES